MRFALESHGFDAIFFAKPILTPVESLTRTGKSMLKIPPVRQCCLNEGTLNVTRESLSSKKRLNKKGDFLGVTSSVLLQYEECEPADFFVEVNPCSLHSQLYSFMPSSGWVPKFTAYLQHRVENWSVVNFQCDLHEG